MSNAAETSSVAKAGPWFSVAAMLLMLLGVAAVLIQKGRESAAAVTIAKTTAGKLETAQSQEEVRQSIDAAKRWQVAGLAIVFLAMVSWGAALQRREPFRVARPQPSTSLRYTPGCSC